MKHVLEYYDCYDKWYRQLVLYKYLDLDQSTIDVRSIAKFAPKKLVKIMFQDKRTLTKLMANKTKMTNSKLAKIPKDLFREIVEFGEPKNFKMLTEARYINARVRRLNRR